MFEKLKILLYFLFIILLCLFFDNYEFLIFFISISLHEFSHCIVGVCLGYTTRSIKIYPFGLSVKFEQKYIKPIDDLIISLSGPLINLIIYIIFFLVSKNIPYFKFVWRANLILFFFNMLPVNFLDGGRILKLVLKFYVNYFLGYTITNLIGFIFGCIILFEAFHIQQHYKSMLFISLGFYFIYKGYYNQKDINLYIIDDLLFKTVLFKKKNILREKNKFYEKNSKILDIMRFFCFNKYHVIYFEDEDRIINKISEKQLISIYFKYGNLTLSECLQKIEIREE